MLMRAIAGATLILSLGSGAHAGGQHGVKQRVSCSEVRYYVAKYSAATAEIARTTAAAVDWRHCCW